MTPTVERGLRAQICSRRGKRSDTGGDATVTPPKLNFPKPAAFNSGFTSDMPRCPRRFMTWVQCVCVCVFIVGVCLSLRDPTHYLCAHELIGWGKMRSLSQKHLISRGSEQRLYHLANRHHYCIDFFVLALLLSIQPSSPPWTHGAGERGQCVWAVPRGRLTDWPRCLARRGDRGRLEERTQIHINNIYLLCRIIQSMLKANQII